MLKILKKFEKKYFFWMWYTERTTKSRKNNTNTERNGRVFRNIILASKSASKKKKIPCARVGGRVLFGVQALDEYLKEKEENSIKK